MGGNHQRRFGTVKGILRGICFVAILVQAGHVHQYTPGLDIKSTPRICSRRIPFTLQARQKIASPCILPVLTQQHLTIEDIESIPAPADFPVTIESNPNRSLGFGVKLSSRKITTPLNILRPLHKKKPTLRIVTRASHLKFPAKIEASIRFRPQHSF